jgi:hypothetical protein
MRHWSEYFKRFSNVVLRIKETCGAVILIRRMSRAFYVYKQRGEELLNAS